MTEEQINYLVNRFLSWRLPGNFSPDGDISFARRVPIRDGDALEMPSGTNLLDAGQARQMILHMIEGMPVEAVKQSSGQPTGMPPKEAVDMMQRCKSEIVSLRAEIDRLQPKAHAYDSVATVLGLLPRPSVGMGENVVWTLDKRIRELTPKATENVA